MSQPVSKISEVIDSRFQDTEDNLFRIETIDQSTPLKNEIAVKLNNPFDFDSDRFAQAVEAPTLERFLQLTEEIIEKGNTLLNKCAFTEEYPLERIDMIGEEIIAWRLISRKPANMSADGKSRTQKGFNFAYHLRSVKYPDKVITVESRPIDHIIEFSCWAKRARVANSRALWLERLLIDHTWAYQAQGIDRFFWDERLADTFYNMNGQALYQRPLRFLVRLYEFRAKADQAITNIGYNINGISTLIDNTKSIL